MTGQEILDPSKGAVLMSVRRLELLKKLEEVATGVEPANLANDCAPISFQIMYGLPWDLQIRAACVMCEHYLPTFETKWPGLNWPRELLGDVHAWHHAHGEGRNDAPDEADSADGAYLFCFDFLLCAYHNQEDRVCLTAGSCGTMAYAAYARATHVWLADDPVAARIEQEKSAYYRIEEEHQPAEPPSFDLLWKPEHNAFHNVAFIAVYRREWQRIAAWLRAEAVWKYPEPDDMDAMMRGLKRWEAHQFYPMGPEPAEEAP